ncbi:MAG: acetate--CoA ligase [Chitinophagaceae bacterium]|nr:acetate--CoA ligase [Chitinophagaceae bacterium]
MSFSYQIKDLSQYKEAYKKSVEDPEGFWSAIANEFIWRKKWDRVLEWNFKKPEIKWFVNAKLNITENCIDRWAETQPNTIALLWEANDPAEPSRSITYRKLLFEVCRFANVLKNNGVKKGDRVCIYMPMIPELMIGILACARIGAIHSVVFGGFSAQSIRDRINDASCSLVLTADGGYRGAKQIPLKEIMDVALRDDTAVKKVIVFKRTGVSVSMQPGRDIWWHDELKKMDDLQSFECTAETMDAEDILFILYTSGSTGKPKGVVLTCGGYMVYTNYTFINVFQYKPRQIFFCTADIGWITGHSYIIYGPLSAGATTTMFEGIPTWPDSGRFWEVVDKHKVNILYTAPTAIRSLMAHGLDPVKDKKLDSLQVIGTVGEPINEEAWHWYHDHIGKKKCPVVDTWWQTETGGIMISNLAGITPQIPSFATLPLPGIQPVLMDENGKIIRGSDAAENALANGKKDTSELLTGNLCIKFPWPGMLRTTYGDHERCRLNYFTSYPGFYFTGDGCFMDTNGNYRITGRVDDVLNVSGHRIGTAEIENAIDMEPGVIESAVVGFPHEIKGQGIYAFVIHAEGKIDEDAARKKIIGAVTLVIGVIAKPDKIQFVAGLPKTRSGKIMRRILRKIAEGETENLGDTSTLLDPSVVEEIRNGKI